MPRNRGYRFNWEGRELELGIYKFKIEKQLSKWVDDVLAQRHVLTLAHYVNEDIPVMLKIRYELNPKNFPIIEDVEETREIGRRHHLFEASLYKLLHEIGHGPKVMMVTKRDRQSEWMPYPEGRIFFTVLRRVPGENVGKIRNELSR
ncbi:hypothetical protein F66182_16444 [Fusarium sp. NRRL 66182]|nr:hypothetical protein F66182_16444 [Fusarium sp. NRRL 66182]